MKKEYKFDLPKGKEVKNSNVRFEDGKVILECELEDIYIPKFGDIVRLNCDYPGSKRDYMICIMPNKQIPNDYNEGYFDIANISKGIKLSFNCSFNKRDKIIPASEAEKQELFDKLAEVGKKWNAKTKTLEDIRWEPYHNQEFWYINEDFVPIWDRYSNKNTDHIRKIKMNNCFKTEEAAQKVANQIKEIFRNSKVE